MKLTKETAIILTYQLWKWMQEKKQVDKVHWSGFNIYGYMTYSCPCCEYLDQQPSGYYYESCVKTCPLIGIWPAKRESDLVPCCRKGRLYDEYSTARDKDKPEAINKMVSAIEGEMKRLGIKNREVKVK